MPLTKALQELRAELSSWFRAEQEDWDAIVQNSNEKGEPSAGTLWSGMPTMDSKKVAATFPIIERHTGVLLDMKAIRPGGYQDFEDMWDHLLPEILAGMRRKRKPNQENGGRSSE